MVFSYYFFQLVSKKENILEIVIRRMLQYFFDWQTSALKLYLLANWWRKFWL